MDKQERLRELLAKKGIRPPVKRAGRSEIKAGSGSGPFRLSFAQRRMWFLQVFDPHSAAYNNPAALRICGSLDCDILKRCVLEIINRHEICRVVFREQEGEPLQVPRSVTAMDIPTIPLQQDTGTAKTVTVDNALRQAADRFARRPFDLREGPLLKLAVVKIADDDSLLLVNLHHIISDGWSQGVMIRELVTLYNAFAQDKPSPLEPLALQYRDYVEWQHERMRGDNLEKLSAYWQEKLAGAAPLLHLPTDFPRLAVQTDNGTFQRFYLSPKLTESLKALARSRGVTLFMLLLALFKTLLFRYTGQQDILVGTPVAGRGRVRLETLIGLFLNTLVLRTGLEGNPEFIELLRRVKQTALEAMAHQDLPFEKLVELVNPERNLSYTPLYQAMFQLQNAPMPEMHITGLQITPVEVDAGFAQVDLSLTFWEEGDRLKGTMEYNTDLFEADTIKRMIGHYKRLAEAVPADPQRRLFQLPILTDRERHNLLVGWNRTDSSYPEQTPLHRLVEESARRHPQNEAVICGSSRLTYALLNRRADRLALRLNQHRLLPGTCIGICLESSTQLVTAILAVLKGGAAYIPMDPQYPDRRLQAMIRDARPQMIITQLSLAERFGEHGERMLCIDGEDDAKREQDTHPVPSPEHHAPHRAACVIYTSGSSGAPRGIVLEHRGVVNLVHSFIDSYSPGPTDSILPLTSIASASFVGELFPVLAAGGTVVLAQKEHFLDMKRLAELLDHHGITILSTVPAMIARLNAAGWDAARLRLLLSGGETLTAADIEHLPRSITIVNGYGLTETTICSTFLAMEEGNPHFSRTHSIPVGKPIINTRVYILDAHLNPVPQGVTGEIHICGDGLARGYLNDTELTAARFIANPFLPGSRMFKTGDLGCWLPDGTIRFIGRSDAQVQVHGQRIELTEIESHLGLYPDVQDAAVVLHEFLPGDRRLVAYLAMKHDIGGTLDTNGLRDWLTGRIPQYMIPALFQVIPAIPLTTSGKVDTGALPPPSTQRPHLEVGFHAPRTETESDIALLWQEFLALERVGVEDNFFDLGGHSLLLTRVHGRLNSTVRKEVSIVDLFRYPTIRSLAAFIDDSDKQEEARSGTYSKIRERAARQRQAFKNPGPYSRGRKRIRM
jgi:aspartate racemase